MHQQKPKRFVSTFFLIFLSVSSQLRASTDLSREEIVFRGQKEEKLKLEKKLQETRMREEQVPSTCTRDIPYEEEVCSDETRYRRECDWVPPRQDCGTRSENRCTTVTRYRQECSGRDGGRVCEQVPVPRECRREPSRQVCTDIPSREVCTDRPTREVCNPQTGRCTTVGGGRHCTQVGGGQSCREVGGGEVCTGGGTTTRCRDLPDTRVCQQVPYQDRDCTVVSVPYCEDIPGRNVCTNIPYTENVCRNVTRTRSETYACTKPIQVPYQVTVQAVADVEVQFIHNLGTDLSLPFKFELSDLKTVTAKLTAATEIFVGQKLKRVEEVQMGAGHYQKIQADILLLKEGDLRGGFLTKLTDMKYNPQTAELTFVTDRNISKKAEFSMKFVNRKRGVFRTIVSRESFQTTGEKSDLKTIERGDGKGFSHRLSLSEDLKGKFSNSRSLELTLELKQSLKPLRVGESQADVDEFEWNNMWPVKVFQAEFKNIL